MMFAHPTMTSFKTAHSNIKRPFERKTAAKNQIWVPKVPTGRTKIPTVGSNVRTAKPTGVAELGNKEKYEASARLEFGRPKERILWATLMIKDMYDNGYTRTHYWLTKSYLSECLVLGKDFKVDDSQVLLRTPRQHNMYSIDLNNIVPQKTLDVVDCKGLVMKDVLLLKTKDESVTKLLATNVLDSESPELLTSPTVETAVPTVSTPIPTSSKYIPPITLSLPKIISSGGLRYSEPLSLGNVMGDFFGDTTNLPSLTEVKKLNNNMETDIQVRPTPTLRINKDHPKNEPKKILDALKDESWVEVMQEELLQFKIQKVWVLVDCPKGYTKWMAKVLISMGLIDEEFMEANLLTLKDPEFPDKFYRHQCHLTIVIFMLVKKFLVIMDGENQDRKCNHKGLTMFRDEDNNVADLLTKPFDVGRFQYLVSKALTPGADEPASPPRDDSHGEAFPTATSLDAGQDRENIPKTSAMPHESSPRVTSLGGDEGSLQLKLNELMDFCTKLQSQHSQMAAKIKRGMIDQGEDFGIERDSNKSTDKGSESTGELANVLSSMGAANILASGGLKEVFITASPPVPPVSLFVPTVVATTSEKDSTAAVITTTTDVTPYTRRTRASIGIEETFISVWESIQDFVPMDSKLESKRFKRTGTLLEKERAKRLKTIEGSEQLSEGNKDVKEKDSDDHDKIINHQQWVVLVRQESSVDITSSVVKAPIYDWKIFKDKLREVYQIFRVGQAPKAYPYFEAMLKEFDRDDMVTLWKLVKDRFKEELPNSDLEKCLFWPLKVMFEPVATDGLWQFEAPIKSWRLYKSCRVHCLIMEGMIIYMLDDVEYPLPKTTLQKMLDHKCEVSEFDDDLIQMINLIREQIKKE
ncbi:hypothetical protein Tco_0164022 [Tanacetum coccineum]